jgi:hypothetical protein
LGHQSILVVGFHDIPPDSVGRTLWTVYVTTLRSLRLQTWNVLRTKQL